MLECIIQSILAGNDNQRRIFYTPYNPKPVSEGGNRSIDESLSRQAPEGKFRIIGVDTFDGGDWLEDDCDTLEEAQRIANKRGGEMTKMYIYNDKGEHMGNAGTF